jgi:hypothetical protein
LPHTGLVGVEALLHRRVGQAGLVAHHLAKALREQAVDLGARAGAIGIRQAFGIGGGLFGDVVGHQVGGLRIGQALGTGACRASDGQQNSHQGLLRGMCVSSL